MKGLILFDFDGTLTKKDSFPLFINFNSNLINIFIAFIFFSPMILGYFFGVIKGENLKRKILSWFFKGMSESVLNEKGEKFIEYLNQKNYFNKDLIKKLVDYVNSGHTVAVVSASPDIWILPFCKIYSIDCISTKLQYRNGFFTGNFSTRNCNYYEKKNRVLNKYRLVDFSFISVYGDSKGDEALMTIATEEHWIK